MNRTRTILTVIAVALVLLVAGVIYTVNHATIKSGGPAPRDFSELTSPVAGTRDDAYLAAIRNNSAVKAESDSDLLDAGHSLCKALRRGASIRDVAAAGEKHPRVAGTVLAQAVSTLCPSYQEKLDEFLNGP